MSAHEVTARRLLAGALGVEPDALPADASLDSEPMWSSLAHMRLLAELEAHLGAELDARSALEVTSLARIVALLERHDERV